MRVMEFKSNTPFKGAAARTDMYGKTYYLAHVKIGEPFPEGFSANYNPWTFVPGHKTGGCFLVERK